MSIRPWAFRLPAHGGRLVRGAQPHGKWAHRGIRIHRRKFRLAALHPRQVEAVDGQPAVARATQGQIHGGRGVCFDRRLRERLMHDRANQIPDRNRRRFDVGRNDGP